MSAIVAYKLCEPRLEIVPARKERAWMEFYDRFPYKCLPLPIANQTGWEILADRDIRCWWNGGERTTDVTVLGAPYAKSHFGTGIVTFNLPYLFRTPAGIDLWVRGPANMDRCYAQPLEGIVETWWLPFTFTMNWRLTTPNVEHVFHKGDPICRIVPWPHEWIESMTAEIRDIATNPDLERAYIGWRDSRSQFTKEQREAGTLGKDWQKHYAKGTGQDGVPLDGHKMKVTLAHFKEV